MVDLHRNCQGKGFFAMAVLGHHTVLVQNHRVPVQKTRSPKLKILYVTRQLNNQTVNLKTDSKTLYYSILKLKYSRLLKHNKG